MWPTPATLTVPGFAAPIRHEQRHRFRHRKERRHQRIRAYIWKRTLASVDVSNKRNDKRIGILVGRRLKSRRHTLLALGGRFLRERIRKGNHAGYETFQLERTQLFEKRQHRTTASAIRPGPFLCRQEVAYCCFVVAWTHEYVNLVLVP